MSRPRWPRSAAKRRLSKPPYLLSSPTAAATEERATSVTHAQLRDAWPEVLDSLQKAAGRRPWTVVSTTSVHAFDGEVLTLGFTNENDVASFRPAPGDPAGESVSEHLRAAILDVLGVRVKFLPRVEAGAPAGGSASDSRSRSSPSPNPSPQHETAPARAGTRARARIGAGTRGRGR